MVEISLGVLFKGFNASKFILYISLLLFVALISLKLDEKISLSYVFVFSPLWMCNLIVFVGAIIGIISYCISPPSTNDIALRVDFTAMIITTFEHLFLCAFVTLTYIKLEFESSFAAGYPLPWTIVFCPIFSLSILSIGIAVWALRHDKPFEFEFFYSINIVQLVFISFKLDKQLDWGWAVVFIPLWAVLSLCVVGVLYALVLSIVLIRSRHFIPSHRRQHVYSAILHTFLVIPALICLILLTGKLETEKEGISEISYTMVFIPLMVSLFFMTLMAAGFGGAAPSGTPQTNVWWYGLRQPLCPFLLDKCPSLRTYANVSYRLGARNRVDSQERSGDERLAVIENGDDADRNETDGNENRGQKSKLSGGSGSAQEQANFEIAASSSAISRAMIKYRDEFGYHWISDIAQPD